MVSQCQAGWRVGIRALQVRRERLLPKSPDRLLGNAIPILAQLSMHAKVKIR